MIYLLIGVAIIALTNLGTLSILTRYIDIDRKEKHQKPKNRKTPKKKRQTKTKKRKRK